MPVGVAFQDGEAGLLGHGDGSAGRKFRRAHGLHGMTLYALATFWTTRQGHRRGRCVMFKAVSTQPARRTGGNIEVQRHESAVFCILRAGSRRNRANGLSPRMSGCTQTVSLQSNQPATTVSAGAGSQRVAYFFASGGSDFFNSSVTMSLRYELAARRELAIAIWTRAAVYCGLVSVISGSFLSAA